jgi:hypothetical protein
MYDLGIICARHVILNICPQTLQLQGGSAQNLYP